MSLMVALLAVVLTAPSLGNGLVLEDLLHGVVASGRAPAQLASELAQRSRYDLFTFVVDDAGFHARSQALGWLPWWTAPHLHLAFWRPVASLTHLFDQWAFATRPWLMWLGSALCTILLGLFLRALLPTLRAQPLARFCALSLLLCVAPACATAPAGRLLVLAGIPAALLLVLFVAQVSDDPNARRSTRGLAIFLLVVRGAIAPLLLVPRAAAFRQFGQLGDRAAATAIAGVPAPLRATATIVLVTMPDMLLCAQNHIAWAEAGEALPARLRCLGASTSDVEVTREDAHTLRLSPRRPYLSGPFDGLFRSRALGFAPGEIVALPGVSYEIVAVSADGLPTSIRARFELLLDDPRLYFRVWRAREFQPFTPPPVGGVTVIPGTELWSS